MSSSAPPLNVRIGALVLDERTRELRGEAGPIALQPKVFDVLVYLVRARDRVVPREELQRAVWGDVSVAPDSVTRALGEVRRALGRDHEMVRTYTGRGVRFVGPVHADEPAPREPVAPRPAGAAAPAAASGGDALVGRDAALASLAASLARVAGAPAGGGLRVVVGAPGTGKSALLAAAEARARAAGLAVLRVDTRAPLAPHLEGALAAGAPAVLLHEDLGQALGEDDPRRLVEALARGRVLVIAACCVTARGAPPVASALAAAAHADPDARITLGPLDREALADLAARELGRVASPAALAKLEALSGGNPRLARQVLHLARQAERPLETLDELPASFRDRLREVVLDHVAIVGPVTRDVLEATAILDTPFTIDVAAEIAGVDAGAAEDALADAALVELVVEIPEGRWRFAQEVVRAVIERAIPPSRRTTLHARAAVALAHWLGTPPTQLERIARHAVAGARAANAPEALALVRRAGQLAVERMAFGAAARWLGRALDVEALIQPRVPARRRELWLELAKVQSRDGQVEAAAEAFAAAGDDVASARRDGRADRAAFLAVAPAFPVVVERFYELMFTRHPELRSLFRRAPEHQRRMFGEAIAALVDHADDPAWLRSHLATLGERHAAYGTTPAMYGWARAAFLDALEEGVAPRRLDEDVRETWERTFDAIADAMLEASTAAEAAAAARLSSPR